MDFCVHCSPENFTLRGAHLKFSVPERLFTKLFLSFYFLYPHPSSLPLTRIKVTCRLQQRVERKTIRTLHFLHFHPVANCLCSARGKCVCEKIFETALQLKTKMLTICGKGLPNVIVCETKMLEHIFMHSVNCRKNDCVLRISSKCTGLLATMLTICSKESPTHSQSL